MNKRRILAIFIAFVITVVASAMWSASTIKRDGDPDAITIEDAGSAAGTAAEEKKGNKVVRVITAPFKAFGRLFRHKNDNKLQRMTEKDAEKFETVGVARVDDSLTPEVKKEALANTAKEHLTNGRTYLVNGQLNEAIAELSTATSMDAKLNEAHNLLGVAFDRKGLGERARESFQQAVKVEPEDAQSLNNLGFSLYQSGNYRAAVDRLKRAKKLAPTDERILNNLGLAFCRLGKFDDAYKYFARATGAYTANLNTARMLERLGRDEYAIKYYEAARRIDPNSTLASKRLPALYKRVGRVDPSQPAAVAVASVPTVPHCNQ